MNDDAKKESSNAQREQQYDTFVGLLSRHDVAIRRFIRYLLPSRDGIDDVMQETAIECWNKFSQFKPASSDLAAEEFVRWACVIARYKSLSWQRDHARDRLVFRDQVVEQLAKSDELKLDRQQEQRSAVDACLQSLDSADRRLVLSVHSPGESIARIAEETGEQARRLYRKLNTLRSSLMRCVERRLAGDLGNG